MAVYRILVPTVSNEGKPFRKRHHIQWDKKVLEITGGLTINAPTIVEKWLDTEKKLYTDRNIPVDIICNAEEINVIREFTKKHYNQKAVCYYKISDEYRIE